jgi:hypothetical protein
MLLSNAALLSDSKLGQLREYVDAGASLLATFETGLYTGRNHKRADFGLADVLGIPVLSPLPFPKLLTMKLRRCIPHD